MSPGLKSLTIITIAIIASTAHAAENADRVLLNGTIETMNTEQPTANAVALKDGKITYVGTREGVNEYIGRKTDVIDLDGKYVTPGLIDVHNHVIEIRTAMTFYNANHGCPDF